jgi:hypothetical protein
MSAKVCAMAEGPVCATEECRRERISDSGMFLLAVSDLVFEVRGRGLDGREGGLTYQCGQRNVASEVVNGVMASVVRSGVVRRVKTGDVFEDFGVEVGAGAEVGWIVGWEDSGEGRSEGCEESLVAPRAGEPGWESAREA